MNLTYIIISIVLLLVLLESMKHLFTKSFFHFVMLGLLFILVIFLVFEGLGTENSFVKDNTVVATGAAVVNVFKDSDIFENFSFESLNPLPKIKNIFLKNDSEW
jgi:hypothetical protein